MQKGSIVLISFTGKETASGRVFDTTDEKIAKEHGFFKEEAVYRPVPVIIGKGEILSGIDEALEEMKEGEEKTSVVRPEKAFGERKPELIRVVPLHEFTKRKIAPFPGLIVDVNGIYGKVQTISGGRVRIDFNPELAGKSIEYTIKIIRELKTPAEKAQAFAEKYFPLKDSKVTAKIDAGKLTVSISKELPKNMDFMKKAFEKFIKENVPGIKELVFAEQKVAAENEARENNAEQEASAKTELKSEKIKMQK